MAQRPLFSVAVAFAAGIVLSALLRAPLAVGLVVLGSACALAAARRAFTPALLILVAAAGFMRYDAHTRVPVNDLSHFLRSRVSAFEGRIISDVDIRENRALFTLAADAVEVKGRVIPVTGRVMVTHYRSPRAPDWQPPDYGEVIRIRTRLSRPSAPSNPGDFSWRDYLARRGIYTTAYIRSDKQIERLRSETPNYAVAFALRAREHLAESIGRNMPPDEASVVIGIDLGTYTVLPDRLLANFKKTGTLHLLAASGFNCAVLVVVFGFILTRIVRLPRKWINLTLIGILVFYMLMIGAKPSIVRATIMATLLLLGWIINRPSDPVNLLFAAALIILAINPADIFDIGFQLSFAAVLALIIVLPAIEAAAERWRMPATARVRANWRSRTILYLTRELWQGVACTAAATLGTLPLSAHYFNQVSIVSVAANAIVAASVLPIFAAGLLMPVLSPLPLAGDALSLVGTAVTRAAISAINWFGDMPYSCASVPSPGAVGVAGYYLVLAGLLRYAYSRIPADKKRDRAP
ncbi:MAG: ComEC/Rec2 family competence protein [Armatimonadetes bacterium]|nr:ComEC/Rec2 family competence protein [Armatimonadota bacterium]